MTDTTTLGTIEHVDPNSIEVETNIRTVVDLPSEFVDSIREHGVLQPVLCRRKADGGLVVRAGQRRVLGARQAERATVPAYVVDGDESAVTRLIEQFFENEQRESLTMTDRAAFFQQLSFEGMPPATIAKRTGTKKTEVEAAIAVAASPFAQQVTTERQVSLDQAATMIEFEGDERAVDRFTDTALNDPDQFEHEAQRQRDRRARDAVRQVEADALQEQGYTVLERRPGYWDKEYVEVTDLVTKAGAPVSRDDLIDVTEKFAHVDVQSVDTVDVSLWLTDFKSAGFKKVRADGSSGGMTDEQKAERRTLIANNKAWGSAEVVRRDWLRNFLARKALPKDVAAFVTASLVTAANTVAGSLGNRNEWACDLLGIDKPGYGRNHPLAKLLTEHPAKTGHVAVAVIVGAFENTLSKDSWRRPNGTDAAYLAQIAEWGYPLSEVEQIITNAAKPKAKRTRTPRVSTAKADAVVNQQTSEAESTEAVDERPIDENTTLPAA